MVCLEAQARNYSGDENHRATGNQCNLHWKDQLGKIAAMYAFPVYETGLSAETNAFTLSLSLSLPFFREHVQRANIYALKAIAKLPAGKSIQRRGSPH